MTHCSLFKEVAQRIVQRAQSSQNDAQPPVLRSDSARRSSQPAQMSGSTFGSSLPNSPRDSSAGTPG